MCLHFRPPIDVIAVRGVGHADLGAGHGLLYWVTGIVNLLDLTIPTDH